MRLVAVLLALLVVGLLVARQLGGGAPAQVQKPEAISDVAVPGMPTVPTKPQDLPQFEKQVEGYVNDLAAERAKQLEQAESGK
ncbi:hypothetical protein KIH07_11310 [Hydrogenophaga taeniospiralis]|uniref:hypothetical protein n=1 Tax=Hydrogenophaga taeniospiralis TaxID=65656 RepID=UPI0008B44426|nr:hypothetical protein [Hydrogenophaga taeniospiralis]MCB4364325.1 hypothetical protein [Hydrogenophaga taeniospiralis]OGB15479.1 MAG: hypothetical protein A3I64_04690 [Burkholderiales bacterium RIFCSPLOWO2_02_FULL_67_64]OGB37742.1 MAG: hypothetical protein A3E51_09960 [Burkholderiales bacterium RIFCSPHIGHO2_12_FULL_67_38]OGB76510.1 MAG: hypothetical protein A3G82_19560 [Burkholderiales bacterium RIFCSPLOWO2_12_FULL_67_210]